MKPFIKILFLSMLSSALIFAEGCGFFKHYDFKGSNIPEDIGTFTVDFFGNEASLVNPQLSMNFTEKLKTKFQTESRLGMQGFGGDYQFSGAITEYRIYPATLNADVGTSQNQFSIKVRCEFNCAKYPEKNFTREFSFFKIFDANQSFESLESQLSTEIIDQIIQQIFAAVALDW
ncbi:MAG: LPS assembly lipoprotein LptE [Bacteroidetes bacterium]|nr:LPS assembly lipoprotein LptE [Bacteroidota bacterium]